jgi:FMN phosphatase YigB (HAD superfamily)
MKTILFDFGNVVAFFDHGITVAKLLPHSELAAPELMTAIYGGTAESEYERGRLTTREFFDAIRSPAKLTCTFEQFEAAFADIFTPNAAVCDLIPFLKPRYRLMLASNTNAAHYAHYTAKFAEVLRHFDALCPSHTVGHRKPTAEYFAALQPLAEAEPADCLFIDDLSENIEAAERHGWRGLVYSPAMDLGVALRELGIQFDGPLP